MDADDIIFLSHRLHPISLKILMSFNHKLSRKYEHFPFHFPKLIVIFLVVILLESDSGNVVFCRNALLLNLLAFLLLLINSFCCKFMWKITASFKKIGVRMMRIITEPTTDVYIHTYMCWVYKLMREREGEEKKMISA